MFALPMSQRSLLGGWCNDNALPVPVTRALPSSRRAQIKPMSMAAVSNSSSSFSGLPSRLQAWLPSRNPADTPVAETAVALPQSPTTAPVASPEVSTDVETVEMPILGVAGGGIFFFWEIGVLKYLRENFDLSRVLFTGASAGALAAVLCACNVDLDGSVKAAYRLASENEIFTRPQGLAGIWGRLIKDWLEEVLPEDAAQRCQDRVKIVVTEAPSFRLRYIENFETKSDVINALMASVHIPFFLDGNATYEVKGQRFIDGSLYDFLTGANSRLLTCNGVACVIDYFFDETLTFNRLDFVKNASYNEVKMLVRSGYAWAEREDEADKFEEKLATVRKPLLRRALELPGRGIHNAFFAVN